MTDEVHDEKGVLARLVHVIQKHKKSSWAVLVVFLLAAIAAFNDVRQFGTDAWAMMTHTQRERDAVTSLVLGDAISSVSGRLGEPRQSLDLCSEIGCTPAEPHDPVLNIYRHEDYTVRAVFDGNKLEFYAVTREAESYKPHLKMPFDWGSLGEFTYTDGITPDDVDAFHRRFPSYAEVKPLGSPGHDVGTVLGYTPDGYSDNQSLYLDGLSVLDSALSKQPVERVAAAELFRKGSKPNTQGIFRDDSYVGNLLHSAQNARQIISAGAER
jgi:hypothetical protein